MKACRTPLVGASARALAAAFVFLATASGAFAEDGTEHEDRCLCHIDIPDDAAVEIGVVTALLGGSAAWFHGTEPFPATIDDAVSLGILPLTTGADTSVVVLFGQTCKVQVPPLSDLHVTNVDGALCPVALQSRSPAPPSNGEARAVPPGAVILLPPLAAALFLLRDHDDDKPKSK